MTTLHVLNASPSNAAQLSSCLRLMSAGDGLMLCGEAVQALRDGSAAAQQLLGGERAYQLYALEEDVLARGIDAAALSVTLVDYPAFVALCVDYARVNSWT
ncbi:MAG: sulfurtransferase complex subunit TusB [Pseudomonas sp.]|jgi:tRNA 2-thiouridine synthesizing protein B|nr:sulfurtransferase complex subunit TusB [Pseudomonas sp.]MDD2223094.1 sulfurtransferase complex subunit TusB [Pseudomonas sp.]MDY0414909.1 sulfurtransferase complex subunit TusB [Pseudomonas sp.]NLO54828.1 sulfurtransferase complex subunit TusB [Gammaproteobacteria bacterium]